jgi:hypothetical protein
VQGVHTNCRVSYSAEQAQVVAVADVVDLELLSYNKVKAWRPGVMRFSGRYRYRYARNTR